MDKIFQEEENHLAETEKLISSKLSQYECEFSQLSTEIRSFVVLDNEDLRAKQDLIQNRERANSNAQQWRSVQSSPYFGRLDLDCEGENELETLTYYIGKEGISDNENVIVCDWRTPIGSCFYATNQTKFKVKNIDYVLSLRRSLDVKEGKLVGYHTDYDGETGSLEGEIIDPFLLTVLKDKRRHNRLTDIIRTIQSSQNEIIRKPITESFIVQGCAGSGKTMILLHRLSYLKFNNRTMPIAKVKIITPNKFFDAHINDLSTELGLTSIGRFSVEEYYVSLIKRYSSKVVVDAEVQSEKILNPELLSDIYSLQYQQASIAHYHEYWEQVLAALQEPKLRGYFDKFALAYPDTKVHTAATVSVLEQAMRQMLSAIPETKKKRENNAQRMSAVISEINIIQEELRKSKDFLDITKKQTVSRIGIEAAAVEDSIQKQEEEIRGFQDEQKSLSARNQEVEIELRELTSISELLSQDTSIYTDFDQFMLHNDAITRVIRREYADLIKEITEAEIVYKKIPVYNFGKRNTIRRQVAERKKQFSTVIPSLLVSTKSNLEKKKLEMQASAKEIGQKSRDINESIQERKKNLQNQKGKLSALIECSEALISSEMPDTRNALTLATHRACSGILSAYEEKRTTVDRLSRRLLTFENTKRDLEQEQGQLAQNTYSASDFKYLDDCLNVLKKLQFSEITHNVMFRDLHGIYRQYKQNYQKSNYRHKVYLKLLYCSMYFMRPINMDTFLNVDEAQDISIAEYRLLRMILGEKCVFNLYGDINQGVYSYKGITDWDEIADISKGNVYVLNENYRNTLQITDFCNKEFDADVYPIGVSGPPVLETDTASAVKWLLDLKKAHPNFRVAIIHRHGLKAIHNCLNLLLTGEDVSWYVADDKKLSVLSVETAKGLEFEAVVAIVDQMTNNEKYISYTRALDYLTVVRDSFSKELDISESDEYVEDEFDESSEDFETIRKLHQELVNVLTAVRSSAQMAAIQDVTDTELTHERQLLVSKLELVLQKKMKDATGVGLNTDSAKAPSSDDSFLIADFNAILEKQFGPDHKLSALQQNIVLTLYHGNSVACNAPSGTMKSIMLYLLALKERQRSGKQTLLTAEAYLQENELVLADRFGLECGIITSMDAFRSDFKKEKYDLIFVPYDFFRNPQESVSFVDYFKGKITYWGLDHPLSARNIWTQLNNYCTGIGSVMFLMEKSGFGNLDLSNFRRIDISEETNMSVVVKHTLPNPEEKTRWLIANLGEIRGQGIIYCDDGSTCKELSKCLRKNRIKAEAYIDVLDPENRERVNYLTNSFTNGGLPVLVTTQQAGKNLSNPKIRFVIHYDVPENLELYQLHVAQIGKLASDPVVHDLFTV